MEELQMYANKIAYLLRVRYELASAEIDCIKSVEELDSTLFSFVEKMVKEFRISTPEMYELFLKFFWSTFRVDEEYQRAYAEFGKDFAFTEDFLREILEERIDLNTLYKERNHENSNYS